MMKSFKSGLLSCNQQIIDTYHSMIRTDLEIPPFIQALTSIEEEMLASTLFQ